MQTRDKKYLAPRLLLRLPIDLVILFPCFYLTKKICSCQYLFLQYLIMKKDHFKMKQNTCKTKEKVRGYLYIISNSSFPNYYKIGVTTNIKNRLIAYQTSSPFRDYKIEHYICHNDIYNAEKQLLKDLKYFQLSRRNEWIEIDLAMLNSKLDDLI